MLNKIPKDKVITDTDKNGSIRKYIWVDILEKQTPGQYGDTHTIVFYNKETREKIYLGDFKPQEFGNAASAPAPQDDSEKEGEDLPF